MLGLREERGQGGAWLQPPVATVCSPWNKGGSELPLPLGTLQESPSLQQQKPFPSLAPLSRAGCNPLRCPPPALSGCLELSLAPACPSPSRGTTGSSCGGDPGRLVPSCSWVSTCPRCWDFRGAMLERRKVRCSPPGLGGARLGEVLCAGGAWLGVLANTPPPP